MRRLAGIPAARGYAIGPAWRFRKAALQVERRNIEDPESELTRVENSFGEAIEEMGAVIQRARQELAQEEAAIFEAQLLMLQDPALLQGIREAIKKSKVSAEFAVKEATERYALTLEAMEDKYFKARAADVRDVAQRVLRILLGAEAVSPGMLPQPVVVIAEDLAPSDTVQMDKRKVLGFCTVEGSETSHTAILARSLGIPAVVGAGADLLTIPNGTELVVDGSAGEVVIDPSPQLLEEYSTKRQALEAASEAAMTRCKEPAITADGQRVEVVANIGSLEGARSALRNGAEGVGLLRTEFLYMGRDSLPGEDEQYGTYREILAEFGQLPVVLRTSDIGGDKELPYLAMPKELNPFLGVRGLRLAMQHADELFRPQLRAAIRAGKGHDLRIMFPMVATAAEVRRARQAALECREQLVQEGQQVAERLQIGIMVEVPSAAVMADILAPEVDFFSVGTNDLTQYTLAADRTNPQLAELASAFSPAVLRLIQNVIQEAHKRGKWVGVCGELAGEPLAIPILLGMELDEFSMNPQAIPRAKQAIRSLRTSQCRPLAEAAVRLESAEDVRSFVLSQLPQLATL